MRFLAYLRYPAYFVVGGFALHWAGEKVGVLRDPPDMGAFQWQPAIDRDPEAYYSKFPGESSSDTRAPAVMPVNPNGDGVRLETQPYRPENRTHYPAVMKGNMTYHEWIEAGKPPVEQHFLDSSVARLPSLPSPGVMTPDDVKTIRNTLLRPQITGRLTLLRAPKSLS